MTTKSLLKRDHRNEDGEIVYDSFWWSPEGYIVKWAILAFIFLAFTTWFLGGYLHAQRRMKRGLRPLRYHRFLVSRSQRARFEPDHRRFHLHGQPDPESGHSTYAMQNPDGSYSLHTYYAEPPPVYNQDGLPPAYKPEGGPDQQPQPPPQPQPGQWGEALQQPPAPQGPPAPQTQQGVGSAPADQQQQQNAHGLRMPQLAKLKALKALRR